MAEEGPIILYISENTAGLEWRKTTCVLKKDRRDMPLECKITYRDPISMKYLHVTQSVDGLNPGRHSRVGVMNYDGEMYVEIEPKNPAAYGFLIYEAAGKRILHVDKIGNIMAFKGQAERESMSPEEFNEYMNKLKSKFEVTEEEE